MNLGNIISQCMVAFLIWNDKEANGEDNSNTFGRLTTEDIVAERGYPLETHNVTTSDGYILGLYRIPHGNKITNRTDQPAVLLIHGLLGSSDNFVITTKALAYYLSDRGYDVWLGNCRGNKYSRRHVSLNPGSDKKFWNFSWHEMGVYDLPAMIDYTLETTGRRQIFYIGHSQGTTVSYVMASERPDYNDKIKLIVSLAPSAFQSHSKQPLLHYLSRYIPFFERLADAINLHEIFPFNDLLNFAAKTICGEETVIRELCVNAISISSGYDAQQINRSEVPYLLASGISGASVKAFLHYGQLIVSGHFRQYDYGQQKNLVHYKLREPPDYKLQNIRAPVALFHGKNDFMCSPEDVELLRKNLPNVVLQYLIPYKYFNHLDFLLAIDADKFFYDRMLTEMEKLNTS